MLLEFRFTYFSRATLEYIQKVGKQADVLHLGLLATSFLI